MENLHEIKHKQSLTTDESLNSTRRMVHLLDETKEAGIKTLVALDDQGEQLDLLEQNLTTIKDDMKEAQKTLSGLEKSICWQVFCECCGTCTLLNTRKSTKEDDKTWSTNDDGKVVSSQLQRKGESQQMTYGQGHNRYIGVITGDAREAEMEHNMEQVSVMIGNIRNMALDMGGEIETQNQQLEKINSEVEYDKGQVDIAIKTTEKLVHHH